jgi:hypothetical protein
MPDRGRPGPAEVDPTWERLESQLKWYSSNSRTQSVSKGVVERCAHRIQASLAGRKRPSGGEPLVVELMVCSLRT